MYKIMDGVNSDRETAYMFLMHNLQRMSFLLLPVIIEASNVVNCAFSGL